MPIIMMNTKTYFKHFIHDVELKDILDASYILASNHIKYGSKYKDQCQTLFYPPSEEIIKIHDDASLDLDCNSDFIKGYKKYLKENIKYIATMVRYATLNVNDVTIILCSVAEEHAFNHLRILQSFVYEEFGYLIPMYKKGMGLYKDKFDQKLADKCQEIIKKEEKKRKKKLLETERGRIEYYSHLDKKKLKKLLKKEGYSVAEKSHKELIEDAVDYLD